MTTVTRRTPRKKRGPDITELAAAFAEFRRLKNAETEAKRQHEKLRDDVLMPALVEYGEPHGEKGQHLAIPLPEPIDGLVRLVRRANTSTYIDVDKAEELATALGVLDEVQAGTVTFTYTGTPAEAEKVAKALRKAGVEEHAPVLEHVAFSQDRLYAFHQANRDVITEQDIDDLLVTEVKYAFFPERS